MLAFAYLIIFKANEPLKDLADDWRPRGDVFSLTVSPKFNEIFEYSQPQSVK